jgi:hypothetical protein
MSELNLENEDVKRVGRVVTELGEHFDSVQIFATRCESGELGGTITVHMGTGNWFTRYGQVKEWIVKQDEYTRIKCRIEENDKSDSK